MKPLPNVYAKTLTVMQPQISLATFDSKLEIASAPQSVEDIYFRLEHTVEAEDFTLYQTTTTLTTKSAGSTRSSKFVYNYHISDLEMIMQETEMPLTSTMKYIQPKIMIKSPRYNPHRLFIAQNADRIATNHADNPYIAPADQKHPENLWAIRAFLGEYGRIPYSTPINIVAVEKLGTNELSDFAALLPGVDTEVYPPCLCHHQDTIFRIIIHLNDRHKWTRERIADWLDELADNGRINIDFKD